MRLNQTSIANLEIVYGRFNILQISMERGEVLMVNVDEIPVATWSREPESFQFVKLNTDSRCGAEEPIIR